MRKLMFISGGLLAGFVLAVALKLAFGGASDADAQLVDSAPPIPTGVSASVPVVAPPANASAAPAAAPVDSTSHFVVDPAQSNAKLLVQQTGLLGNATLVGTGTGASGDVFLTKSGQLGSSPSALQLDLRTMKSTNSELNTFLKNDLEAAKFPMAVFSVESVSGIPENYTDGNEFSFTMSGQLTMHGITRPSTWTVKARQVGDFLTFAADTDFNMTDYNWTPPDYGVARAKNGVHLQIVVVAGKAP